MQLVQSLYGLATESSFTVQVVHICSIENSIAADRNAIVYLDKYYTDSQSINLYLHSIRGTVKW